MVSYLNIGAILLLEVRLNFTHGRTWGDYARYRKVLNDFNRPTASIYLQNL